MAKITGKSAGTPAARRGAQGSDAGPEVTPEERERMIREAANYRAAQRGLRGGDPIDDWLAAEREVNRAFPSAKQRKEELAAYKKLREQSQKLLTKVRDTVDADTIRQTVDKAAETLTKTGKYTADTVTKATEGVKKDIASAAARLGNTWDTVTEKTADLCAVWQDRSSVFLSGAARGVGDWLRQMGGKLEHPIYRTGEMAAPGTLECVNCSERVELPAPAHVPLCPKCRKMEFRRI